MKKRYISIFLTIMMITSMFTGVSYADDDPVHEISGITKYLPYGETESEPMENVEILIEGLGESITSDNDGHFSYLTVEDLEGLTLKVSDTDEYEGDTQRAGEDVILLLKERFTANLGMLESEWISEPIEDTEVVVRAKEGYSVSCSGDGEFSDSVIITVSPDGAEDSIYVKDQEGHVSKPFAGAARIDRTSPVITEVEVSSSDVSFRSHGIYGNSDANLLIAVTFEEGESGFSDAVLYGALGVEYAPVSYEEADGVYRAVFIIPNGTSDTLYVRVTDNVGNSSAGALIKATEGESMVVIENNAPILQNLTVDKAPNERGWYNSPLNVIAKGIDAESGLYEVKGYIGETEKASEVFEDRKIEEVSLIIPVTKSDLTIGPCVISAEFTDNSGNKARKEISLKIDMEKPVITVTGSNGIIREASDVEISLEEDYPEEDGEVITVKIIKNGIETEESCERASSVTIPKSRFSSDGIYEVRVNAVDAAGNEAEEKVISFTVDKTAPSLNGIGFDREPNENGWYSAPVTFYYSVSDLNLGSVSAYVNGRAVNSVVSDEGMRALMDKYYRKGTLIQYWDEGMPSAQNTVLDLSSNETQYTVCSDFTYDFYYNEFGISDLEHTTKALTQSKYLYRSIPADEWTNHIANGTLLNEITSDLKVGDLINIVDHSTQSGHVMMVYETGDDPIIIHSTGSRTAWDERPSVIEAGFTEGSIRKEYLGTWLSRTKYLEGEWDVQIIRIPVSVYSIEITNSLIRELGDGVYEVRVTARDSAGNIAEITDSAKIDITRPNLTLSGIEEGKSYGTSPTLSISSDEKHFAEDGSRITVSIDKDGEITEKAFDKVNTATINSFNEDGNYTIKVNSIDAAGNTAEEKAVTFIIDKTAPKLIAIGFDRNPNENGWYDKPISFVYTVNDATSGIDTIEAFINDSPVETSNGRVEITEALIKSLENEDGTYTVKVIAKDKSGNSAQIIDTAKIDIVKPVLTLSNIEEGKNYQAAPNLNIESNEKHFAEAEIVVLVERNGEISEKTYQGVNTLSINEFSKDGHYIVKVNSTDAAGNKASEREISFTVDTANPVIKDLGPDNSKWYNSEVIFNFGIEDETSGINSIAAKVNGVPVEIKDNSITITKMLIEETINSNGTYTIELSAIDRSGNEKTFAKTFRIDFVKPNLSFEGVTKGAFYQEPPVLRVISDEKHFAEASIKVLIERNGNKSFENTYDGLSEVSLSEFKEDGKYKVTVSSVDAAGNISDTKEISFTKDNTPAVISDTGTDKFPNENGWFNTPVTATFDISDATGGISEITATVNGKAVPYSEGRVYITESLIRELANDRGTFTLVVTAKDRSGNIETMERTYKIDLDKPNITLSGVEVGAHYQSSPTLSISSDDRYGAEKGHQITVEVIRDGASVYTETFAGEKYASVSQFVADGDYTVRVNAVDAAGNTSDSREISFVKDGTAPVVMLSGVEEGKYYNSPAIPEISINERYYESAASEITLTRELNGQIETIPLAFVFAGEVSTLSRNLADTGLYTLTVTARDEAGNVAEQKTISFYVDTVAPKVTLSGVENAVYSYNDIVAPIISYEDDYFENMSFTLTRAGEDWKSNIPFSESKDKVSFSDFAKTKENDGVYSLTVVVTDKAGNVTEESVTFTVNRFGSYFKYDDSIKALNGKHVQSVDTDLRIYEFNVTKLKSTKEEVKLDGKSLSAYVGNAPVKGENGYQGTKHVFEKKNFTDEGVYEINVISEDSSGNIMESKAENGVIRFVVDRTAPVITISGLSRYINAEKAIGEITIMDHLSPDNTITAFINDEPCEIVETEEGLFIEIGTGNNQKIRIVAKDAAGNEREEVYTVSIIPSGFVYTITKNLGEFVIGGISLAVLGLLILLLAKSKKDKDDE